MQSEKKSKKNFLDIMNVSEVGSKILDLLPAKDSMQVSQVCRQLRRNVFDFWAHKNKFLEVMRIPVSGDRILDLLPTEDSLQVRTVCSQLKANVSDFEKTHPLEWKGPNIDIAISFILKSDDEQFHNFFADGLEHIFVYGNTTYHMSERIMRNSPRSYTEKDEIVVISMDEYTIAELNRGYREICDVKENQLKKIFYVYSNPSKFLELHLKQFLEGKQLKSPCCCYIKHISQLKHKINNEAGYFIAREKFLKELQSEKAHLQGKDASKKTLQERRGGSCILA